MYNSPFLVTRAIKTAAPVSLRIGVLLCADARKELGRFIKAGKKSLATRRERNISEIMVDYCR